MYVSFLKLTLRDSANTCSKLISVTVTALLLWKTYGQQSNMPFCTLWICTYQRWKSSLTNILKWYNSDIRHHLNCIHMLRKRCISRPTIHNSSKLQLSETQFQHKMLAAKANFEAELILNFSPNNISRVYKYINSITRHDAIPQNVSLDSQMATSHTEKANVFNTFFYSVFTWSSLNLPPLEILPIYTSFNNLQHHNIQVWCLWCVDFIESN